MDHDEASSPCYETILVVEDEPTLRNVIDIMLEELGYNVLSAATPIEAIRLAENQRKIDTDIHLLLSDIIMPGMTGIEMARAIDIIYPGIPCLYMSGYVAKALDADSGVDPSLLIQKPFSLRLLASRVRKALDSTSANPNGKKMNGGNVQNA